MKLSGKCCWKPKSGQPPVSDENPPSSKGLCVTLGPDAIFAHYKELVGRDKGESKFAKLLSNKAYVWGSLTLAYMFVTMMADDNENADGGRKRHGVCRFILWILGLVDIGLTWMLQIMLKLTEKPDDDDDSQDGKGNDSCSVTSTMYAVMVMIGKLASVSHMVAAPVVLADACGWYAFCALSPFLLFLALYCTMARRKKYTKIQAVGEEDEGALTVDIAAAGDMKLHAMAEGIPSSPVSPKENKHE